jgi:hypothetical protein
MTGVEWGRLLEALDDPVRGHVAKALADATDIPTGAAFDRVDEAVNAGELVARDTGGTYRTVTAPDAAAEGVTPQSEPDTNHRGVTPSETEGATTESGDETPGKNVEAIAPTDGWANAAFDSPESGVWPPELL